MRCLCFSSFFFYSLHFQHADVADDCSFSVWFVVRFVVFDVGKVILSAFNADLSLHGLDKWGSVHGFAWSCSPMNIEHWLKCSIHSCASCHHHCFDFSFISFFPCAVVVADLVIRSLNITITITPFCAWASRTSPHFSWPFRFALINNYYLDGRTYVNLSKSVESTARLKALNPAANGR